MESPNKVVNFWVLDLREEYPVKQRSAIKNMYWATILAYKKFGEKIVLISLKINQKKE